MSKVIFHKKPYLVVPHLIEQPTWGGDYILETKNWTHKPAWKGKKIGQSYELSSQTLLAQEVTSSADKTLGDATNKTIAIEVFKEKKPFPLIKFTQAKGNSFQLHTKPGTTSNRWVPKAESWYYFEPGKMTFGIKKGTNTAHYRQTCEQIETYMKELSKNILKQKKTHEQAQKEASEFIREKNPWQYVNVYDVSAETLIDLSGGGLHHSWEEDPLNPLGNVVYEVQQDVMDPVSTIRSFDQGKILADGSVREIHIDDYFHHLDLDEKRNTYIPTQVEDQHLFSTPHYSLSRLAINSDQPMKTESSFHHLFVKEGEIIVASPKGRVEVTRGHSCFVPLGVEYIISPKHPSIVLQTFVI